MKSKSVWLTVSLLMVVALILSSCQPGFAPFTIAVLPDTQMYTCDRRPGDYSHIFVQQCQWIIDNKDKYNIKLVIHTGDVVDTIRLWDTDEVIESEWDRADLAMSLLDGEVPYLVCPGNHDYENNSSPDPTVDQRELTFYDDHFPISRFSGYSWYGGHYPSDSNSNSYGFFTVDDQEFMVIALEWLPSDDVLDWTNIIITANSDKHVIVATHMFTDADETRYETLEWPSNPDWNTPEDIWDKCIKLHDNIHLVVGGHTTVPDEAGRMVDIVNGEPINQCECNYQALANGGNGWLRLYEYNLNDNEINASTYSPCLSSWNADEQHQFTLEFRATGSGYQFAP